MTDTKELARIFRAAADALDVITGPINVSESGYGFDMSNQMPSDEDRRVAKILRAIATVYESASPHLEKEIK